MKKLLFYVRKIKFSLLILLSLIYFFNSGVECIGVSWDWGKWWTYDGISGPQFWGLINPDWSLCTNGRRQSPVNLDPDILLFDPNLRPIHMDKHRVSGVVNNTGHSVVFTIEDEQPTPPKFNQNNRNTIRGGGVSNLSGGPLNPNSVHIPPNSDEYEETNHLPTYHHQTNNYKKSKNSPLNITGGPLSYRYRVSQVQLHFGSQDHMGSEHTINGTSFPAELQIYGYNSQLFNNFSEAVGKAHGAVAISIMVQIDSSNTNPELRLLTDAIGKIRYAGSWARVHHLSVRGLIPTTDHYITYEGSLTQPPCHETVTWILINKPIYVNKEQLEGLRMLRQGDSKFPKAKMVNNFRQPQVLHHRPLRTNIDFSNANHLSCPSMATPKKYYRAHNWR